MIDKELKKLGRKELVDVIYQMKKNEQELRDEIASLKEQLQERRLHISTAGSIAEVAAEITNILAHAQKTADIYLYEIACMKQETEKECAKLVDEANAAVTRIISDGEKQCADFSARYLNEQRKWQELHAELQMLKEMRQGGKCEETDHGEEG